MRSRPALPFALAALILTAACGDDDGDGAGASGEGAGSSGGSSSGTGGDGQGGDGGNGQGGNGQGGNGQGGAGGQAGEPIVAPEGEWTWVGFDDALCANGNSTGLGINPGTSDRVVIYLMGGGACWDHQTCYVDSIAANIVDGFDAADFAGAAANLGQGPFDRSDPLNPFRDDSLVWIPYCTGDIHGGDRVTSHSGIETHHVGYANIGAFLSRLVPTFPSAAQIVLTGGSAGGFGALINWDRTQIAFGATRVDMIDDSGILLPNPFLGQPLEDAFDAAWDIKANLPAGCASCQDDMVGLYGFVADKYPASRGALLTYYRDNVIAAYMSITLAEFTQGLGQLGPIFTSRPSLNAFGVDATGHVLMGGGWGQLTAGGVPLRQWVSDMVNDDPTWTMSLD